MRHTLFFGAVLCLLSLMAVFAPCEESGGGVPWRISADSLGYDENENCYNAAGNVVMTGTGLPDGRKKRLSADSVRFCPETMDAFANGNVFLETGEDTLSGAGVALSLGEETGVIHDGALFLHENNFHISGHRISKTGDQSYSMENAGISTCDGENPAWEITCRNLDVTIEGYGFARGAAFRVKGVPVLYSPFFVFPAKTKRATGLLFPRMGHSDRMGLEYTQPFFWAMSQNRDATFYVRHSEARGEMFGGEYRYILDDRSKGMVAWDYLYDQKIDTGSLESEKNWGYDDDGASRPNNDRYWFRAKHDQGLFGGIEMKLDVDIVSDQDYLHEFRKKYNGYQDSQDLFNDHFGRHIDDYNDAERVSRISFDRVWEKYGVSAEARWYDDVTTRRQSDGPSASYKLPDVQFFAARQRLGAWPVYAQLDSNHTWFDGRDGKRGHRTDVYSRVYLPFMPWNMFYVEPFAGARQTVWNMESHKDGASGGASDFYRTVADGGVTLSSEIYSSYPLKGDGQRWLRHIVLPEVAYEYISSVGQEDYPFFDSLDRIAGKNSVTWSITNLLMLNSMEKRKKYHVDDGQNPDRDRPVSWQDVFVPQTRPVGRIKLSQIWNIDKRDFYSNPNDLSDEDPGYDEFLDKGFFPISLEMGFSPLAGFSLGGDMTWSMGGYFLGRNISVSYLRPQELELSLEYRYSDELSETIFSSARFKVWDSVSIFGYYESDLATRQDVESGVGIRYNAQCWFVDLEYSNENDDQRFDFKVGLAGFDDF